MYNWKDKRRFVLTMMKLLGSASAIAESRVCTGRNYLDFRPNFVFLTLSKKKKKKKRNRQNVLEKTWYDLTGHTTFFQRYERHGSSRQQILFRHCKFYGTSKLVCSLGVVFVEPVEHTGSRPFLTFLRKNNILSMCNEIRTTRHQLWCNFVQMFIGSI